MYMVDTKVNAKNETELGTLLLAERKYSQDILIEFGIKMNQDHKKKQETTHNGNKWNYQVKKKLECSFKKNTIVGNIGSRHHQTSTNERKIKKG